MLNDSLASAKRALLFFGCMATLVAGLTFGAGLQLPTDQSSTTVAELRSRAQAEQARFAGLVRQEQPSQAAADRAVATRQALAESGKVVLLR